MTNKLCSTCNKPSGSRWEHGPKTYCSVKCAEGDGWNPIQMQPVGAGAALKPAAKRSRWDDPMDGITFPKTFA